MDSRRVRLKAEGKAQWSRQNNTGVGAASGFRPVPELDNANTVWVANSGADTAYEVGDTGPAGGVIFEKDGDNYKEAAPLDAESVRAWRGLGINTSANSDTDGAANTAAIVSAFDGVEYDDWFLPSKDELNAMYTELHLQGVGGFASAGYWSSSESSSLSAWSHGFGEDFAGANSFSKNFSIRVRAVRDFEGIVGDYSVRDTGPAGGLIFHIEDLGGNDRRFYEAAPEDLGTALWGDRGTEIGGTGTEIGTGASNTDTIVAHMEGKSITGTAAQNADAHVEEMDFSNSAALYCDNLEYGGFSDWYLPAPDELDDIFTAIVDVPSPKGGFSTSNQYWTSKQDGNIKANAYEFGEALAGVRRSEELRTRPIRAFTQSIESDGSKENPYRTITKALAEIDTETYISSTSDTYSIVQTAPIDLAGAILIADSGKRLRVIRSGADDDITIQGGTIRGCDIFSAAGESQTVDDAELRYCNVYGGSIDANSNNCILNSTVLGGNMSRCVIHGVTYGVYEPDDIYLVNCSITNCGVGLLAGATPDSVFIRNCIIAENGIDIYTPNEITVSHVLYNRAIGTVDGVQIEGAPMFRDGFRLKDIASGYLIDSQAVAAGDDGDDLGVYSVSRSIIGYDIPFDLTLFAEPKRIREYPIVGDYSSHEAYDGAFFDVSGKSGTYMRRWLLEWDNTSGGVDVSKQIDELRHIFSYTGQRILFGTTTNGTTWYPYRSGTGAAQGDTITIADTTSGSQRWRGYYVKIADTYYRITDSTPTDGTSVVLTLHGADLTADDYSYSIDYILIVQDKRTALQSSRDLYVNGQWQEPEDEPGTGYNITLREAR